MTSWGFIFRPAPDACDHKSVQKFKAKIRELTERHHNLDQR